MQSESSQDQIDTLVFNQLRSGFEAQSDTSLSAFIKQGQHLAISGVSGCGKSSLLQVIAGLKAPQSGSVTFNNQLIDVKTLDLWRQSICYFPQQAVMGGECVRDVLHLPWRLKAITHLPLPSDDLCLSALSQAGITVLLDKPIDTLSGGEKQRVAIARGILMQRKVWLMDEPTSALDPAGRDKIIQLLAELSMICISVSHDPIWLKGATQVHTMHLGKGVMSESMNSTLDIQWVAMAGFYLLLLIPIFLFQRWQLGLNRTLINSVLRMTLQLSVVGIYLHTLFGLQSVMINIVWLSIMALVASYTICKRAEVNLKRVLPAVIVGQFTALIVALPVMLMGVIQVEPWWQAQYMIPIAGMLLGNSLMANVLALSRWGSLLKENHNEYQYYVSLGAPDPALPFIQTAVKAALTPQLAAMTTLGIVSLPGMMTGQILGGAAPLVAVKYQLVIMVAIFISGVISVATTLSIVRRVTFNAYGEVR